MDILCKTSVSIACQAVCLALHKISIAGVTLPSSICAELCTVIVNEGCEWAKTLLCETRKRAINGSQAVEKVSTAFNFTYE
ncbi:MULTISPECIES: hypothetical protein [Bacillota]|uniref:hypothetical protein n=1 Tax=Bacillota TaxID=1239 RepID=UPI00155FF1B0|nr:MULTISPECIES: hypothetical protein [Bacillota]NRG29479.1 hypothetical protein [Niallia circulans]